jgi:ATP-dependent Clp protease adaptor protein ClpS
MSNRSPVFQTTYPVIQPEVEVLSDVLETLGIDLEKKLIVYNDDVNTFDFVIETLVEVCGHTLEQAEQCTWIIHYKGKCAVKLGSVQILLPMRTGITDRGISAEIE